MNDRLRHRSSAPTHWLKEQSVRMTAMIILSLVTFCNLASGEETIIEVDVDEDGAAQAVPGQRRVQKIAVDVEAILVNAGIVPSNETGELNRLEAILRDKVARAKR